MTCLHCGQPEGHEGYDQSECPVEDEWEHMSQVDWEKERKAQRRLEAQLITLQLSIVVLVFGFAFFMVFFA